jgi:hypothetical protein
MAVFGQHRIGNIPWAIDDDGDHWDVARELKELVAVGFMVAVEAPDPVEHRRAREDFACRSSWMSYGWVAPVPLCRADSDGYTINFCRRA